MQSPTDRPGSARSQADDTPSSFPTRPPLTTPRHLLHPGFLALERERLAAQPRLGLVGLLFAAAVFVVLSFGTGDVESSLLVIGPIATYALTVIAMIAFWWDDWPGTALEAPLAGLVNTALVVVGAVALTIGGQAVVERIDLQGVFTAQPGLGRPTTFPATLPLAAAGFAAMLQLTIVSEGWPLRGLGRLRAGVAALAASWAIAVVAFVVFVNYDSVPAGTRAAVGLRNPGGPVAAADFGAALIAVGVWQAFLFIAWRGWPFADIQRRWVRILSANVVVIGGGTLTYLLLREVADWQPSAIGAACGCVISATLIVAMLFDGWPTTRMSPASGRVLTIALVAVVAIGLNRALAAYADHVAWSRATADDWVTMAALTFIGAGIILHVAIGRRWPLAPTPKRGP